MRATLGLICHALIASEVDPTTTEANPMRHYVVPLCDSRRARFIENLGADAGTEASAKADAEDRAAMRAVRNGAIRQGGGKAKRR